MGKPKAKPCPTTAAEILAGIDRLPPDEFKKLLAAMQERYFAAPSHVVEETVALANRILDDTLPRLELLVRHGLTFTKEAVYSDRDDGIVKMKKSNSYAQLAKKTGLKISNLKRIVKKDKELRWRTAMQMRDQGATQKKIADAVGVSDTTISRWIEEENINNSQTGNAYNDAEIADNRIKVTKTKKKDIVKRLKSGESQAKIADAAGLVTLDM